MLDLFSPVYNLINLLSHGWLVQCPHFTPPTNAKHRTWRMCEWTIGQITGFIREAERSWRLPLLCEGCYSGVTSASNNSAGSMQDPSMHVQVVVTPVLYISSTYSDETTRFKRVFVVTEFVVSRMQHSNWCWCSLVIFFFVDNFLWCGIFILNEYIRCNQSIFFFRNTSESQHDIFVKSETGIVHFLKLVAYWTSDRQLKVAFVKRRELRTLKIINSITE